MALMDLKMLIALSKNKTSVIPDFLFSKAAKLHSTSFILYVFINVLFLFMNTKRVLLSCTVISVQDSSFVYPCCQFCLSRLTPELNSRSRCPKCGVTYEAENVDYRFRLSLKVSRDTSLFGVTVFGGCLKPFFGVSAGGLQRFIESEKFKGPQSLHQLLTKAVEDCFIGKCLVFGFKLDGRAAESCLLGQRIAESVQVIACQIIPPHGTFLGITVFAYLQSLMQANARSDCCLKAGGQWRREDSSLTSFDHTLPLCQNSQSESSSDAYTLPHPWHSMPDPVLCFSSEETRGCSLTEGSFNNGSQQNLALQQSSDVQGAKSNLSESHKGEQNKFSTSHESRLNASSPIITTQCAGRFKHWHSEACRSQFNDSPSENRTSFFIDDAPLSETLGDFVSTEPEVVNPNVHSPICNKETAKSENIVLLKNNAIPKYSSAIQSMHSSFQVLKPLLDLTNDRERKNRRQKASSSSKHVMNLSHATDDLLSCDKKDVVSTRTGGTYVQHHATIVQEGQSSGYEDDYNCSADLFHQSTLNILDAEQKKQGHVLDISNIEPSFTSFHFAPSLQSTPIVNPSIQCAYRRRRRKRSLTGHASFLHNHTINRQISQVAKSAFDRTCHFDSALESSAVDSELKVNMKHTPAKSAFPTNDCSKDLFDPSF